MEFDGVAIDANLPFQGLSNLLYDSTLYRVEMGDEIGVAHPTDGDCSISGDLCTFEFYRVSG